MALKAATFLPLSALLWPVVSAHAGVTYSGYQNIAVPQDFNGLYLNVTTGATAFSQPADWNSSSWINPIFGGVHAGSSDLLRPVITGSDQILNLGTGTLISSASTFATGESGSTTHVGAEAGQFTLGTVGTMGFQFETAPGGTTQYGWLNITISNTGAGVIRDWGYEAVAGSIVVGRMEQSAPSGGAQTMTLSPGAGESFTLSSVVSDTGGNTNSLLKTGTGTATLSGANTYTGGTTISAGTLSIGSGSTTGSITGDVTNNSTLAFNRSDELSYAGVVSGTGAVTKSGAGTLTLSGANTYTGGTTISAGTLSI